MVGREEQENHLVESYTYALMNVPLSTIDGPANPRKPTGAFNAKQEA